MLCEYQQHHRRRRRRGKKKMKFGLKIVPIQIERISESEECVRVTHTMQRLPGFEY